MIIFVDFLNNFLLYDLLCGNRSLFCIKNVVLAKKIPEKGGKTTGTMEQW